MKASELRIGNWIKNPVDKQQIIYVTRDATGFGPIRESPQMAHPFAYCHPIPLTEEWLEKFGFKHTDAGWSNGTRANLIKMLSGGYMLPSFGQHDFVTELKYVHQLQNLFFALTGEELTIKEKEETV